MNIAKETKQQTISFSIARRMRWSSLTSACRTKYYNKLRSLDSQNRTSAYFKDWCNNQRLRRNSLFSQMVYVNLTIGAVESHHLSQCLDPADDLDGVFFHPELPEHVNKQADLPAYLKRLALQRIGDIYQLTPFRFIRMAVETIIIDLAAEFTSIRKTIS
ncbi:uncharacterized protein TNCV_1706821 [Trichonephila clavipes]|uniref:Uncharacterized protein n=1 Tax=Trichonephila clavipes TaxID=2585209 RepID=A0A8X6RIU8_TRICX|nr:uncharacterized protein TNCV_1706821 [Trichonephila clavipes]